MSETNKTAGKTARRGARCAAHSKTTPKADAASVAIPADLLIWATAAARANGETVEAWVAAWLREGVTAGLDQQPDGTLPLTRRELDALERIGAERPKNGHR